MGTIDWWSAGFDVSGTLTSTRYNQTSYSYVHWETRATGPGCQPWREHEARIGQVNAHQQVNISLSEDYSDQYINNVWVETCTNRSGWSCSGWK
ncbi:hypothetical protein [Streptantibioticus ferralitis]|uniref:Uncharacterized protein n=1 Tax=Streptantibioticus ferralitis TaxID=236510 RepID=A0ABT5ZCK7_9ACTN|nr:hypothetical protein [Streptantibioticus ferralitis]MDF2261576.1 hypothetical protein [Streptantibioticus ferralitis]